MTVTGSQQIAPSVPLWPFRAFGFRWGHRGYSFSKPLMDFDLHRVSSILIPYGAYGKFL